MRLGALKRHWERLARRDPFWAALTDPDKQDGRWDREQFFRSGAEEIASILQRAQRLGVPVSRRRALDFGCGVGRLTQAMADRFERSDGIDISASMLREARRHNRHPERCFYHLNVAQDLARFPDSSFTFVYSTVVLQHMEPTYSKRYLHDLLRVLAPGGLLVFQLPSHRVGQQLSADAARTPVHGRLPADAFNARLGVKQSGLSMHAWEQLMLSVTVENCSRHVWPALPDPKGRYQIHLANHWLDEQGELVQRDDARCRLPHDLAPAAGAELMLCITAPQVAGAYWLELDLVQENVGWFAERGSEPLRVPCRVAGGLPAPPLRPSTPAPTARPGPERPFRERHPDLFRVLRATGLRNVYWAWRRALDSVKRQRDRAVLSVREDVYERVIPPIVNWWLRRPFAARMEMHCVPRADVLAIIVEAGGRLVDAEEDLMTGGYHSLRYWVVKESQRT